MKIEPNTYLGFVLKETADLRVYLTAAVIGSVICYLTGHYSFVPYLVPLFVQILVRSNVKFRQRHQDALVQLPAQTEDPAFIMDMQGNIVLSTGKTRELFDKYAIQNIKDFISEKAVNDIMDIAFSRKPATAADKTVEAHSNRSMKWYEIKAKAAGLSYGGKDQKILVWFQDISLRKMYHIRLRDLLRYSDSLITSLEGPIKPGDEYDLLSAFLLKEYEAVFITRADQGSNLSGYVFKNDISGIIKSNIIIIHKESQAPINISRMKKQIISGDVSSYGSENEFLNENPFDPAVLAFIAAPIRNFITYNEADLSIIAFNFRFGITSHEKQFFEILVNIYRSMVILVDLKKELQKHSQ